MANTGILYRRNTKAFFEIEDNRPLKGEIVYATDTDEYGALDESGHISWRPHEGIVESVAGRTGEVVLTKEDVGLSNVDNTSDLNKPISNAVREELDRHYDAINPHHVTPEQIGLENVDNTSDMDKPISTLTGMALDLKLDKSTVPTDFQWKNWDFKVKDGELSEFNFKRNYKEYLDSLPTNKQLLAEDSALRAEGRKVILTRANGVVDEVYTQDTIYDDTEILRQLNLVLSKFEVLTVINDLNGGNGVLHADQGRELKTQIDQIKETLQSDNVDLDTLREIVKFIESNKHLIDNLSVENIAGLRDSLDSKLEWVNNNRTAPNAITFDDHYITEFMLKDELDQQLASIKNKLNYLESKFENYYTNTETNIQIEKAIEKIDYTPVTNPIYTKIDELETRIYNTDYSYIDVDLQKTKTELKNSDLEIRAAITEKYNELNTKIKNIDAVSIINDVRTLTDLVNNSGISGLTTLITTNRESIERLNEDLKNYLKLADVIDTFNTQYASNLEPKINEKLKRFTKLDSFIELEKSIETLKTEINEKIKENTESIEENSEEIQNLYQLINVLNNFNNTRIEDINKINTSISDLRNTKAQKSDFESLKNTVDNTITPKIGALETRVQNFGDSSNFVVSDLEPSNQNALWLKPIGTGGFKTYETYFYNKTLNRWEGINSTDGEYQKTFPNKASFPSQGKKNITYVDNSTKQRYVWTGHKYYAIPHWVVADLRTAVNPENFSPNLGMGTLPNGIYTDFGGYTYLVGGRYPIHKPQKTFTIMANSYNFTIADAGESNNFDKNYPTLYTDLPGPYTNKFYFGWDSVTDAFTNHSYDGAEIVVKAPETSKKRGIYSVPLKTLRNALTEIVTTQSLSIDLNLSNCFEVNSSAAAGNLTFINATRGQTGVVIINSANTKIQGYGSGIKWDTQPTDLKEKEIFSYLVLSPTEIIVRRV